MVCAFVAIGPINLNGGIIELANVALQRLATEVASLYHTGMRRLVASKAADPIATISVDQGRTLFGGCAESNR